MKQQNESPRLVTGAIWRREEHGCGEHRGCWGAVTATDGSVLAFAEGRVAKAEYGPWGDNHPMSIVCKRGTPQSDGTIDWGESVMIEDREKPLGWGAPERVRLKNPDRDGGSWSNPTPVVDWTTGRVFIFYMTRWMGEHQEVPTRVFYRYSDDHGVTWQPEDGRVEVTHLYRDNPQGLTGGLPALGHGIQLSRQPAERDDKNGRLIIHVWHDTYSVVRMREWAEKKAIEYSAEALERHPKRPRVEAMGEWTGMALSLIVSDDHGASWTLAGIAERGNESRMLERTDGSILFSIRSPRFGGDERTIALSRDGGDTIALAPDAVRTDTLPNNGYLDQGLIRWAPRPDAEGSRLLWSSPGWLSVSEDEGLTWHNISVPDLTGYSCMTPLQDGSMMLMNTLNSQTPEDLYDRSPEGVEYMRFNEAWLDERLKEQQG